MKLQGNGWCALRKPVYVVGIVALLLILFVGLAYQYHHYQYGALQQAKSAYGKARQKVQLAQQEQADRLRYLPQYQRLVDIGFIGAERRQQWLLRLRAVREQYDLFEIDYTVAQQQTYQPDFIVKASNHRMYRSVMTMELGLLHEGDLLRLLSALRQNTSPFMVRNCEIKRKAGVQIKLGVLQESLKAKCEIDWLTLKAHF